MPVGSISPFCEPATTTSTPHSSMRKSNEASEEIVSTRNKAGCLAASIARRSAATGLATPVEVSLCTASTALIRCCAVRAQPRFELRRVDGAPPIVGQRFDIEPEGLAAHPPVQREETAFEHQHLVAGREQVDERRLPGPVPGRGIADNPLLGLEHALQSGEALLGDRLEAGAVEIHRAAVHRAQDAVRDVGRTRIHEEVNAVRHRLLPFALGRVAGNRRPGGERRSIVAAADKTTG